MIHEVLGFAARFLASMILAFTLLPICLVIATPVILLRALIWPGQLRSDYSADYRWWDRWAIILVP
jgi:hypothetical protein